MDNELANVFENSITQLKIDDPDKFNKLYVNFLYPAMRITTVSPEDTHTTPVDVESMLSTLTAEVMRASDDKEIQYILSTLETADYGYQLNPDRKWNKFDKDQARAIKALIEAKKLSPDQESWFKS